MMTPEQLNLIVDAINTLSTHLHYISIVSTWTMIALWIMIGMKLGGK